MPRIIKLTHIIVTWGAHQPDYILAIATSLILQGHHGSLTLKFELCRKIPGKVSGRGLSNLHI